jgi:hypothetical protein
MSIVLFAIAKLGAKKGFVSRQLQARKVAREGLSKKVQVLQSKKSQIPQQNGMHSEMRLFDLPICCC